MISLQSSILLALFLSLLKVNIIASPINQEKACASYTLVDTRGTYEPQGPSIGFRGMVSGTLTSIPGGKEVSLTCEIPDALEELKLFSDFWL